MENLRPSHFRDHLPRSVTAAPTNDDIEAVIQMATSSRPSPDGRSVPLKDTRTQLFVGNLPYRVRWQDLKDLFRRAGTVLRADVSLGPDNRSRGYGTVLLATAEDAGRAIDMFNGYSWQTRVLEVRPDRLPPDFDINIPPGYTSGSASATGLVPNSIAAAASSTLLPDDLDYSVLLDHYHNLPVTSGPPCRNLFVGNLPFHCQWQDLKDLFRQAGTIIRADVALGQDGRSRGFGTVVFASEQDAERAVHLFNGYDYNGRPLKVNYDKYMQIVQPNGIASNISGTGLSRKTTPTSPTPSFASSVPDSRVPLLSHTRQASSHSQPGSLSLHSGYQLDLASASNTSSPFDRLGSQLQMSIQQIGERDWAMEREERERDMLIALHQLDLESRPPSTLPIPSQAASAASRSASASSTNPPSLTTTASSWSTISSSSSVAASVSTGNTSENLDPPLFDRRKPLSSRPPVSTAKSPPSQPNRSRSNQNLSTHHSSTHPHHPGPISLPPPPPVTAFPLGHPSLSPHGMMHLSLSPLHHPLGSPSSPHYLPHHHQPPYIQQISGQVSNTPHGLPPITPSMPPFNFLPPIMTATNATGPSLSQVQPTTSSNLSMQMGIPMNSVRHSSHPHSQSDEQRRHQFSLASLNPNSFAQTPPATGNGNHSHGFSSGLASATAFSPGTMSPGAFWGRPGTSAVNPMINPAVGAPVHIRHGSPSVHHGHPHSPGPHGPMYSPGYSGHLHSPGHGNMFYGGGFGQGMHEPAGYFDPGYFPPMEYGVGGAESGTSFIENEILKSKDQAKGDLPATTTVEGERSEGAMMEEEGNEEAKTLEEEKSRKLSAEGLEAMSGASEGDTRGWEGREKTMLTGAELTEEPATVMISRTHSMSSKPPAAPPVLPVHRSESVPTTSHSHITASSGKDPKLRKDDLRLEEGQSARLESSLDPTSVS